MNLFVYQEKNRHHRCQDLLHKAHMKQDLLFLDVKYEIKRKLYFALGLCDLLSDIPTVKEHPLQLKYWCDKQP